MTPSDLARMTDHEIATYASGGYGPAKRNEFSRCLREMLPKAEAKFSILQGPRHAPGFTDKLVAEFDDRPGAA